MKTAEKMSRDCLLALLFAAPSSSFVVLSAAPSSPLVGRDVPRDAIERVQVESARPRVLGADGGDCDVGGHQPRILNRRAKSILARRIGPASLSAIGISESKPLPAELRPITMCVLVQMLGEGIAMSSLPLYLTRLGAKPIAIGLAISAFSVLQMTFAPIMVGWSSKASRSFVLRVCLAGAAASSLIIAFSGSVCGSVYGVIAGRALAGMFAACVPVAQSAVTDIVPRGQAALGLSRVSAAQQLGIVVGPAVSALLQSAFGALGLAAEHCLPVVFMLAAAVAISVLTQMTVLDPSRSPPISVNKSSTPRDQPEESRGAVGAQVAERGEGAVEETGAISAPFAQPMLRCITIVIGWTAVLSNSIYGLFASQFLGYRQPQLSATYSAAAALAIASQIALPKVVSRVGEHRACSLGIFAAGSGIGGIALIRAQPYHSLFYLANRAGAAIADTTTAALVARASASRDSRSRNLALLTSTRAAARIASPLLSSQLFEMSCGRSFAPGGLPFLAAASVAMAVAPLPLTLLRMERNANERGQEG